MTDETSETPRAAALHALSEELLPSTQDFLVFAKEVFIRWEMSQHSPEPDERFSFFTIAVRQAVTNDIQFYRLLSHHAPTGIHKIRLCASQHFQIPREDLERLVEDFKISDRLIRNRHVKQLLILVLGLVVALLILLGTLIYGHYPLSSPVACLTASVAPEEPPVATIKETKTSPKLGEPPVVITKTPTTPAVPPTKQPTKSDADAANPPGKRAVTPKGTSRPDDLTATVEPVESTPAPDVEPVPETKCPSLEEIQEYTLATLQQNKGSARHLNSYRFPVEARFECQAPLETCRVSVERITSSLSPSDARPIREDFNLALAAAPISGRGCPTVTFNLKVKQKTQ